MEKILKYKILIVDEVTKKLANCNYKIRMKQEEINRIQADYHHLYLPKEGLFRDFLFITNQRLWLSKNIQTLEEELKILQNNRDIIMKEYKKAQIEKEKINAIVKDIKQKQFNKELKMENNNLDDMGIIRSHMNIIHE